jgi:predicted transcriptional regulator
MSARRPGGALEDDVMEYLWALGAPASPRAVQSAVAPELAYTTLTTVLTRLWEKGRLDRDRRGRSFLYKPVRSEAEHRAAAMRNSLGHAADRGAVLSSFVDALDADDLDVLRNLVGEGD